MLQGERIGRDAADGVARPQGVVSLAPALDEQRGFRDRAELVLIGTVVAKSAVEAFNEHVLRGLSRSDGMQSYAVALRPHRLLQFWSSFSRYQRRIVSRTSS